MIHGWWMGMFSEFIGTLLLILLGNGVCASTSLKKMFGNQPNKWIVVVLGWGFAVFIGATVSSAMGGNGYLNPAVLIMSAIEASNNIATSSDIFHKGFEVFNNQSTAIVSTFFIILMFEILGAFFGQTLLDFINFKFIKDKENDLQTIRCSHCTSPSYKNKEDNAWVFNLSYEFVGTLVLLGCILAFSRYSSISNLSTIPVTFVIMAIGISLGSATGYAINPIRDLIPRITFWGFIKLFRKEDITSNICEWGYSWVPILGPMVAGVIIGCISLI